MKHLMNFRNFMWKSVVILSCIAGIAVVCKKAHAFGIGINPPELTEIRDLAHEVSMERHEAEQKERELLEEFAKECSRAEKERVWNEVCHRVREEAKELAFDSHSYEPGWNGREND